MLVAEPPCDFMLKCHEMRHRNSTDFPGRSVSCSMLSGHDASAPGLLLLGQLCVERVQTVEEVGKDVFVFSPEHLAFRPRVFVWRASSFCIRSF